MPFNMTYILFWRQKYIYKRFVEFLFSWKRNQWLIDNNVVQNDINLMIYHILTIYSKLCFSFSSSQSLRQNTYISWRESDVKRRKVSPKYWSKPMLILFTHKSFGFFASREGFPLSLRIWNFEYKTYEKLN